jgi:outer membrane protein OmpA-like peptidoglycan-associated protein
MSKMRSKIYSIPFICMLLVLSDNIVAQEVPSYIGDSKGSSYRERLIDYADIFSYDVNEKTKDTILYVRKINDYWYGIFGTANFGLSFGNFNSSIDPNNEYNMFNTIIDFYSKFGTGYTFGLVGEWVRPTSDLSFGLKLGAFDRKISHFGAEDVKVTDEGSVNYFDGNYKLNAKLIYFSLNPYVKYSFPMFDGLFVTGGVDVSFAYSSLGYLERAFKNTGDIYHKMGVTDIDGKTRFLINLGVGYDFFIADFFATNNRVRITPFADFKGGTNIITSKGSNWNDVAVNVGLQIKLAPDIVQVDTLRYDPSSEIPIDYMAEIRDENGVEFSGFTGRESIPPSFDLVMVEAEEVMPEPEDVSDERIKVNVDMHTQPDPTVVSPAINMTIGIVTNIDDFATSASTALTAQQKSQLDQYVTYLKEHPNIVVRLEGHSDNRGSSAEQMNRSMARYEAAMNYLMSKGISRSRIFGRGRAALDPVATNSTEAGRRRNRRVSIVLQAASR